jgi:hypothetical protein
MLISVLFPENDFSHKDRFDTSSAIPLQSPHCDLPDLFYEAFSLTFTTAGSHLLQLKVVWQLRLYSVADASSPCEDCIIIITAC